MAIGFNEEDAVIPVSFGEVYNIPEKVYDQEYLDRLNEELLQKIAEKSAVTVDGKHVSNFPADTYVQQKMDGLKDELTKELTETGKELKSLEQAVATQNATNEQQFNSLNTFRAAIARDVNDLDTAVKHLDIDVRNLDSAVTNVDTKVTNLDTQVANLDTQVTNLDKTVTDFGTVVTDNNTKVSELEAELEEANRVLNAANKQNEERISDLRIAYEKKVVELDETDASIREDFTKADADIRAAMGAFKGAGEKSLVQNTNNIAQDTWAAALNKDTAAYGGGSFASGGGTVAGVSYEIFLSLYGLTDGEEAKALYNDARLRACNTMNVDTPQEAGYAYWFAHAEGESTKAYNRASHTEGNNTEAYGYAAHAEGEKAKANGDASHAEGSSTTAHERASHAEGSGTHAYGPASHAEGDITKANGIGAHAEGSKSESNGNGAHAEGYYTSALAQGAHAEGATTKATGYASHAEGSDTRAEASGAHSEGIGTTAKANAAHAEGWNTKASSKFQHVEGKYNIEDTAGKYAHIVGNGTADKPSNAYELDWDGNARFAGKVTCVTPNPDYDAATNPSVPKTLTGCAVTEEYVGKKIAALVNGSPQLLDTLAEIARALGNDPNFATTILTELGNKADKVNGHSLVADAEIERLAGVRNYDDTEVRQEIARVEETIPEVPKLYEHSLQVRRMFKSASTGEFIYPIATTRLSFVSTDPTPITTIDKALSILGEREIPASGTFQEDKDAKVTIHVTAVKFTTMPNDRFTKVITVPASGINFCGFTNDVENLGKDFGIKWSSNWGTFEDTVTQIN